MPPASEVLAGAAAGADEGGRNHAARSSYAKPLAFLMLDHLRLGAARLAKL
jgi:hypothetical protein